MGIIDEAVERTLDFLRFRKRDYQLVFSGPSAQAVLADLARFCRAADSCYDADPSLKDVLIGRHEVWLRIARHLNLEPQELFQIYSGRTVPRLMSKPEEQDND